MRMTGLIIAHGGRGRASPSGRQGFGALFCDDLTTACLILNAIIFPLSIVFNGDCLFLTKFRKGLFV